MNVKTMDKAALISYIAYHTNISTLSLLEDWSQVEAGRGTAGVFTYFRKWVKGL